MARMWRTRSICHHSQFTFFSLLASLFLPCASANFITITNDAASQTTNAPVLELRQFPFPTTGFPFTVPSGFPTAFPGSNPNSNNRNDSDSGFQFYFIIIAVIATAVLVFLLWFTRQQRRKRKARNNLEQTALSSNVEQFLHPFGRGEVREVPAGGVVRHTEGLDELGEAPPAYDADKPPSIGEVEVAEAIDIEAAGETRETELVRPAQVHMVGEGPELGQAVETAPVNAKIYDQERAPPPKYEEAVPAGESSSDGPARPENVVTASERSSDDGGSSSAR